MNATFRPMRRLVAMGASLVALLWCLSGTATVSHAANPGQLSFDVVGDQGTSDSAQKVMKVMGADKVDFVQSVGDLSYAGLPTPEWCALIKANIKVPFLLAAGNHESRELTHFSAIEDYTKPGCLPNPLGKSLVESPLIDAQLKGTTNYAKEYYYDLPAGAPLARIIVISPNLNWKINGGAAYDYAKGSPHYAWVSKAIDDARSAGEWVFVVFHEPYINAGNHGAQEEPTQDLFNMMLRHKVDVILNGHDHDYQRSMQLQTNPACPAITANSFQAPCVSHAGTTTDPYVQGAGTVEIINGVGGAETNYAINRDDGDFGYLATSVGIDSPRFSFGFTHFDVSATTVTGTFRDVSGGGFTDSFTIHGTLATPSISPSDTPSPTPASPSAATSSPEPSPSPTAQDSTPAWFMQPPVLWAGGGALVVVTAAVASITLWRRRATQPPRRGI